MPIDKRRAADRRRAWGRGPVILRFEPLEGRALLSTTAVALPDLVGQSFQTPTNLAWGDSLDAKGVVLNQGTAATTSSFLVDLYSSATPSLGQGAVMLGQVTVPAGLAPGAQSSFDQVVKLPASSPTGQSASGPIYVGMQIDPNNQVAESNKQNNSGVGPGFDLSLITIKSSAASTAANLVGTALQTSPGSTSWGGVLTLTQKIANTGNGDAPATRARVVLTPSGITPGGTSDATIGMITVPAITAGSSANVSQTINLSQTPPPGFSAGTIFTLSVIQDADFITNQLSPHLSTQGVGADESQVTINTSTLTPPTSVPLPALSVAGVQSLSKNIAWGQSFQVTATIQNTGAADAGAYKVRFLLVGTDGTINNSIFLADTTLTGLKAGYSGSVTQTLKLPSQLPVGQTLNSKSLGQIAIVVDPENTFPQSSRAGAVGFSGNLNLNIIGTDGSTTPVTIAPAATTTAAETQAAKTASTAKTAAATKAAHHAKLSAKKASASKFHAKSTSAKPKLAKHTVAHNIDQVPRRISKFFKDTWKKI